MSRLYIPILLILMLPIISIPALAEDPAKFTVNVSSNKFLGNYLVNLSGFALYYLSDDAAANGGSTCMDECATNWPPFYAEKIIIPDNLRAPDFSSITRTDGKKQTTFRGWPLYLFSGDHEKGDVFGSEKKSVWHLVNPEDMPQLF